METRSGSRATGYPAVASRRGSSGIHPPAPVAGSVAGAVTRSCARPGCSAAAASTLRFAYAERAAVIDHLAAERGPQTYDLCQTHAARTRAPHGWSLRDLRADDPAADDLPSEGAVAALAAIRTGTGGAGRAAGAHPDAALGGPATVAILAAALRADGA